MPTIPMSERLSVLTQNEGWFGRAPREFQDAVLSRCEWKVCAAGQTIYQATDEQADFCGIADGAVDIYSRFGAGDNPLLHILHEGFWLGYGTVVARERPRVTAVARVDKLLACVPERVLRKLLGARPEGVTDGQDNDRPSSEALLPLPNGSAVPAPGRLETHIADSLLLGPTRVVGCLPRALRLTSSCDRLPDCMGARPDKDRTCPRH